MSSQITTTRPLLFVWNDDRTEKMRKRYRLCLDQQKDRDALLMNEWRTGLILTVPKGSIIQKDGDWVNWYPDQCEDPREWEKKRWMKSVAHFNGNWIGPYDGQLLEVPGNLFAITSLSPNHYVLNSVHRPNQKEQTMDFLRDTKLLAHAQKFPLTWPAFLGHDLLWQEGEDWKIFPRCTPES